MDNRPIGLFDSGVGGLTVLKEVMKELPNENLIYFGDTARVPYGSKSPETITDYSRQIIDFLLSKDVKMVVIACGTASAISCEILRSEYDIKIVEVITSAAKEAIKVSQNKKIGIIGTDGTIKARAHEKLIKNFDENIEVHNKSCPLFVPLVEEGWINTHVTNEVVSIYLKDLKEMDIDTLILGCTHYPILENVIAKNMENTNLINPALETAKYVKEYLIKNNLSNDNEHRKIELYTSDYGDNFSKISSNILGDSSEVKNLIANRKQHIW